MSNELTISNSNFPSTNELQAIQVIARTAQASGLYTGIGGEAKILMILLSAKELGIGPMVALNGGIWNIQGKIEISARLMNAMIRRAGHAMKIVGDDKSCTISGKRCDTGDEHTETFTIEMAEKAGLTKNSTWTKFREDMLFNRCMSRFARRLCPDVIGTSYVEGEIREAKEVEAQERKLEQADCVVTNSPKKEDHLGHIESDLGHIESDLGHIEKPPLLSNEQVEILSSLYSQCDEKTRANCDDRLIKHYKVNTWNDAPEKSFNFFKTGMENNINMQKQLAVTNA